MILVLSSSSPWASAALFGLDGDIIWSGAAEAPQAASSVLLSLLDSAPVDRSLWTGLVADVGPGSFTGVKVAVTLVKTLGWAMSLPADGVSSFDLVSDGIVELPAKRGWIYRRGLDGSVAVLEGACDPIWPMASRWQGPFVPGSPMALAAEYGMEPSISVAKRPLIMGGSA